MALPVFRCKFMIKDWFRELLKQCCNRIHNKKHPSNKLKIATVFG